MKEERTVTIKNEMGEQLIVNLVSDGFREHSTLTIAGKRYHFERIDGATLMRDYRIDLDPDYEPQVDDSGHCYILAPYPEK